MTGRWRAKATVLGVLAAAMAFLAVWSAPPFGALAQGAGQIAEIRVEGYQRIEPETVRSYMTVRVGDPFDPGRIDKSLKDLFATGLFADVTIRRAGDVLVVAVVENPIINRRAFEGNRRIEDDALKAEVQLRPRVVYTRARVQSDVQRLIEVYRRSGRFAATVDPKVIQLAQNRVDLVFEINEGAITEIRKIRFIGNNAFTDGKLRGVVATKETRWYKLLTSDDNYDPDRLTLDREKLRQYYLARGYADFRVVSAFAELTADRENFFITFTLDEGETYTFGKVEIETELKDLNPEQLRSLVLTVEGETYNAELIELTIEDMTFELGRLGYAFVDIRPRIDRDRENRVIALNYEINQGPRVYVERIDITGNTRTLDKVIRREFRLVEGDAFNTAKLRRSRARIRGLGFFQRTDIANERGSAEDKTVITVDVQEQPTGELSFGAGFSTSEKLIGDVSIRERNLLGRGQDLRLGLGLSSRRQAIDLSFTEPYFLDRPVSAGVDVFNTIRDFQDRSSFDQDSTGMTLRLGFEITERLRQTMTYGLRRDRISEVQDDASRFIRDQKGTTITSALGYRLIYDRRDDPIEPTTGYIASFGQQFAGFGGDVRYIRSNLKSSYYYPLSKDWVISLGLRAGYIFGLDQDVQINNRFYLGSDSFRGFEVGGVGPRDITTDDALGGNIFYVGSTELRFPLGLPNEFGIVGRVFTEVGSLFDTDDQGSEVVDDGALRLSAGFGLSWRSPFGPIALDFTEALLKEDIDKPEFFRFSFGTRF